MSGKRPPGMPMTVSEAPRRIAGLCGLPRMLRYRLALAVGLEHDENCTEEEFLRLPAIQQSSVLARLLKEYDHGKHRSLPPVQQSRHGGGHR